MRTKMTNFLLEIDFGEQYDNSDEGRYDFVKISMVKNFIDNRENFYMFYTSRLL